MKPFFERKESVELSYSSAMWELLKACDVGQSRSYVRDIFSDFNIDSASKPIHNERKKS